MLGKNLRALRKRRGMTQEELAARLHVVRQTVSKWEKGLSVPDAGLLMEIAEVLETTVEELLGAEVADGAQADSVAEQLARINGQLAVRNRRARLIWRTAAGILIAVVVLNLLLMVLSLSAHSSYREDAQVQAQTEALAGG